MASTIEIAYQPLISEIRSFMAVFGHFVDPEGEQSSAVWEQFQYARQNHQPGRDFDLIIGNPDAADRTLQRPIRTIESRRDKEQREWSAAYAEYFMLLRLTQGKAGRRGALPVDFKIRSASSRCVIWQKNGGEFERAATWNIDFGNPGDPGCRFHVQAHAKSIEIPRFLSPLVLPTDCLAFIANELFPISWPTAVAGSSAAKYHGPRQSRRMTKLFECWLTAIDNSVDPLLSLVKFDNYSSLSEAQ